MRDFPGILTSLRLGDGVKAIVLYPIEITQELIFGNRLAHDVPSKGSWLVKCRIGFPHSNRDSL